MLLWTHNGGVGISTNNQCASETAVTDEDKCVDLGCDEKESCEDCASVQGCVWCDTLKDTIGLGSSGSCSTGMSYCFRFAIFSIVGVH